jgi:urea transport system permease protein
MDRLLIFLLDSSNAMLVLMLVSLGLAVIFGLMNVINMAHGEFLVLGAYGVLTLQGLGLPFWICLALAPLIVSAIGLAAEELLIRRTYERLLDTILATWGLSLFLRQGLILLYGPGSHAVSPPALGSIPLFGETYPIYRLIVMVISAAAIAATFWLFFRTDIGLQARAVIANRNMAASLGINTRLLDRLTFSLGAGLAGLAGAVMSPLISIDPNAGLGWLVPGFLSILVAGLGTISGPLAGAATVSATDSLASALTSPVWAQLTVFVAAIIVIRFFPQGLLALRRREA